MLNSAEKIENHKKFLNNFFSLMFRFEKLEKFYSEFLKEIIYGYFKTNNFLWIFSLNLKNRMKEKLLGNLLPPVHNISSVYCSCVGDEIKRFCSFFLL